jgi:hypothetical protein
MSVHTIFAHKSYIVDAFISVVQEGEYRPYYAFLTDSLMTSERCQAQARFEGRKVLYRVRVKMRKDFPIIGRKGRS